MLECWFGYTLWVVTQLMSSSSAHGCQRNDTCSCCHVSLYAAYPATFVVMLNVNKIILIFTSIVKPTINQLNNYSW